MVDSDTLWCFCIFNTFAGPAFVCPFIVSMVESTTASRHVYFFGDMCFALYNGFVSLVKQRFTKAEFGNDLACQLGVPMGEFFCFRRDAGKRQPQFYRYIKSAGRDFIWGDMLFLLAFSAT